MAKKTSGSVKVANKMPMPGMPMKDMGKKGGKGGGKGGGKSSGGKGGCK